MGLCDRSNEPIVVDAHDLTTGTRRTGQWAEEIEDRRKSERLAHRHGVLGRGVMVNCETECDTRLLETFSLHVSTGVDIDPERVEHFGRAPAGPGSVAVLRNLHARGCRDDRRGGRDVEGFRCATRSRCIEQLVSRNSGLQRIDLLSHHTRRADELVNGRKSSRQEGQQRTHLGMMRGPRHDAFKCCPRLIFGKCPTGKQVLEKRREVAGVFRSTEFRKAGSARC